MYLLTVMIQQGDKIYTSNEATDISPEIWLVKAIRKTGLKIVLLNSIVIESPNSIAIRKLDEANIEIVQKGTLDE